MIIPRAHGMGKLVAGHDWILGDSPPHDMAVDAVAWLKALASTTKLKSIGPRSGVSFLPSALHWMLQTGS